MKKITLTLAAFALVFTAFAQDVVIERPADNTTALITTNGSDDAGVFCADFFTLEGDTTLGSFTFPGNYSSAVEIGDLLTGADLYIYQDLNGSPNANPTTANALVNLTSVQLGAGLELRLVDNIESGFIINVTAANGGSQITLPAGDYWVAFAPAVVGGSAGAGRWNWNGSFTTQTGIFPANESLLIDSDNLFGAGATDWTGISSLIGADFPSFAWTLTSEGTTTGGTTFITCADDVFNDTYCYTNNDTTDKVYTSDTGLPLRLTFTGGTVELNFDEVIILDSDGVTNLNAGNPYGNNGDMTGFVFESSGDTLTLRVNSDATASCADGSFVPLIYDIGCLISEPPPGSDIIVRPSNGGTALISTHGNEDLGVYCADFFTLNEPIILGDFTFDGYTSSNGPIASLLLGAELYIYQNAGANPDGNPTAGNAFVNLTNIQQNAGLELLTDEAGSTIFQINVTAANGGNSIVLPAGSYWVAFAPFVQGTSAGAGRWNWNGSSITPANQPVLIDPGDIFGAGATNWTNISSLIGEDFTSLAWTLTSGGTTTPCQSAPAITNPISDYVVCETGSSTVPSGVFDLTAKDAEILNNLVDVTLTYHLSLADADSGSSPIASPFETQSTTIWVRATDDTTSNPVCYSVGSLNLYVLDLTITASATEVCVGESVDLSVEGLGLSGFNTHSHSFTDGNYTRIPYASYLYNLPQATIEFWYYQETSDEEFIIGTEYFDTGWGFHVENNPGASEKFLEWRVSSVLTLGRDIPDRYEIPFNQWIHVAGVSDGITASLFIDGNLIESAPYSGQIGDSNEDIVINRHTWQSGSSSRLNGKIDELRISNTARYSTNFTSPSYEFISDNNTLGLWHFNNDMLDVSPNNTQSQRLGTGFSNNIPFNSTLSELVWSTGETTETISVTPTETTEYWVDGTTSGVTCREYITISLDPTPPELTCPDDQTASADTGCMFNIPDYTGLATATDNCAVTSITQDPIAGTMVDTGSIIITLTASDGVNITVCSFILSVNDITPPELTCPDDQTASADTGCMFNIPDYTGLATATDNCAVTSITQDPIAGTMVDTGSIIITLTASDGVNITVCSFILSVNDTTPPELTCPVDQTVTSEGPFSLPDYFAAGAATATDNCTDPVTVTDQIPNPGALLENGTYTITLTTQDESGLEDECSFTLVVNDLLETQTNELSLAGLRLYPNPASDRVLISNPRLLDLETVSVYDLNGRLVIKNKIESLEIITIDLSILQSATYMIVIQTKYGKTVKRLLIE